MTYGSELLFQYERKRPPNKVGTMAYKLLGRVTAGGGLGSDHPLETRGSGTERTIPAELPPDEYLVVGITEPRGQVPYTFRVVVI